MPFDDHPKPGGGDPRHDDLDLLAINLVLHLDHTVEGHGKCPFCIMPHILRELIAKMFCDYADNGISEETTMQMIEVMASEGRAKGRAINKLLEDKG